MLSRLVKLPRLLTNEWKPPGQGSGKGRAASGGWDVQLHRGRVPSVAATNQPYAFQRHRRGEPTWGGWGALRM